MTVGSSDFLGECDLAKSKSKIKSQSIAREGSLGGPDIVDDAGIDWLSSIVVRRLDATPTEVRPYGVATIRWEVDAGPPVRLTIGGVHVGHSSSMPIHPTATNTYRLIASVGNQTRLLGAVTVSVILDQCVRWPSNLVDEVLNDALTESIENSEENLYFRQTVVRETGRLETSKPVIKIGQGRVDFTLLISKEVDYFPNPYITVRASFGMTVIQTSESILPRTELAANNIDISVDVSFPWYAYLIPVGSPITLALVQDMAEDKVTRITKAGIIDFVSGLNQLFPAPGPNLLMHSVEIYSTNDGVGMVEVEFCPAPSGPGIHLPS